MQPLYGLGERVIFWSSDLECGLGLKGTYVSEKLMLGFPVGHIVKYRGETYCAHTVRSIAKPAKQQQPLIRVTYIDPCPVNAIPETFTQTTYSMLRDYQAVLNTPAKKQRKPRRKFFQVMSVDGTVFVGTEPALKRIVQHWEKTGKLVLYERVSLIKTFGWSTYNQLRTKDLYCVSK